MQTTQEEAANLIPQQVSQLKANEVPVVVDNTEICVSRLHLCCQCGIPIYICLVGFANS